MMTAPSPTIFVVDDDEGMRDSLAFLLRTEHLPAKLFSSIRAFLDAYDPSQAGCLLLDIRMPGNGLSLLKELSARDGHLPIIVITGHGDQETRDKAMGLDAFAFFEKPFDPRQLCATIRRALD